MFTLLLPTYIYMWTIAVLYLIVGITAYISALYFSGLGATYGKPRYFRLLPTLEIFPDSEKESIKVQEIMSKRTDKEELLFQETNEDGVEVAFIRKFPECSKRLKSVIRSFLVASLTIWLKLIYNRARPAQVNSNISPLPSLSALTPSFPSGHALEAYYAARIIGKHCPDKYQAALKLADECAHARVIAGLHYPSDSQYSKKIVDSIPNWLLI